MFQIFYLLNDHILSPTGVSLTYWLLYYTKASASYKLIVNKGILGETGSLMPLNAIEITSANPVARSPTVPGHSQNKSIISKLITNELFIS